MIDRGIDVNKESLATRVSKHRGIADLEMTANKRAKELLGESDSSDDDDSVDSDEDLAAAEQEGRGRKEKRDKIYKKDLSKSKRKEKLGKRTRSDAKMDEGSDEDMSDENEVVPKGLRGSLGK